MNNMDYDHLNDKEVVRQILSRNKEVTIDYLYKKCYPLFKSIFDRYYTDCESWDEFVTEIYVYIMVPSKQTGVSKLAAFQFRCSFPTWLKIVAENYCHQLYAKKVDIVGDNSSGTDIFTRIEQSLDFDNKDINKFDVMKIIALMPNQRYSKLIEYRYIQERSNEETATLLSMSMANYYNKHKLAKAQFVATLRKEGLL